MAADAEYAWDITDLVQAWSDGTYENYGLVMITPETGSGQPIKFGGRHIGEPGTPPDYYDWNTPVLEIDYIPSGCWDNDGDEYYDEACGGEDCDDTDPDINPGAYEGAEADNCDDGLDNDCDGLVDTDPECPGPCFLSTAASIW